MNNEEIIEKILSNSYYHINTIYVDGIRVIPSHEVELLLDYNIIDNNTNGDYIYNVNVPISIHVMNRKDMGVGYDVGSIIWLKPEDEYYSFFVTNPVNSKKLCLPESN